MFDKNFEVRYLEETANGLDWKREGFDSESDATARVHELLGWGDIVPCGALIWSNPLQKVIGNFPRE